MKLPFFPATPLSCRIVDTRDRLYRVAMAWCGDEMLADDLVQETLSTAISKQSQLRDEKRLFAWLYSILSNQWKRYLRSKKTSYELNDQLVSETAGPAEQCEEAEVVNRVRRVVATLPAIERQVISLVDLEEMPYCDVAEVLEIPIGTVMSRLHRARKRLLAKMETAATSSLVRKGNIHLVE